MIARAESQQTTSQAAKTTSKPPSGALVKAEDWAALFAAHVRWVEDFNHQSHRAHREKGCPALPL